MNDLRWILLGVAIVVIAAVYFFSRARKKSLPDSLLNAADEVPSFSAKEESVNNDWMDGVGPVRVVDESKKKPEVKFIDEDVVAEPVETSPPISEVARNINKEDVAQPAEESIREKAEPNKREPVVSDVKQAEIKQDAVEKSAENNPADKLPTENQATEKQQDVAIDDVISVYVLAKAEEKMKGEKILSASYALHLDYGDMKIFHRHSQTPERKIEFSMANIQQPGYFEFDEMNDMQTSGVSFFMQVNLVENSSAVLDEMLICAHSLSTMLGAMLCNGQRNILDETSTNELREKVKRLEEMKSQSV